MEHLLQKVLGVKVMSFLDGFSGYNQVAVHPDDQENTGFTTPWGTFMYSKMPFGLMNVGSTFQRAMDIAFVGEKDKFVLVYLDDITIYSSSHQDHLQHLKKVFLKCRRFGISVNPKKSQFALEEGKLLGHIVSTAGVKIDPERVKEIQTLSVPRSKKDIQSFFGKIDFVRRFIPNFAKLVKHITSMLKKGSEIKWSEVARRSFEAIKRDIMEAPTLISLDYNKEFHIFSFASGDTLAAVLLQKDDEGSEHPVAFFSKTLRDAELRYDIIENKAYALIKSLKAFRMYILHSKVIAYVPSASVKDVLMQPDVDGRRDKWIAKLIEFNIELKPTKLVRGQGLAKLMAEENCRMLDINLFNTNSDDKQTEEERAEQGQNQSLIEILASCEWYCTIAQFLLKLEVPPSLSSRQARTVKLRATKYCIHENLLYWRDPSGILLRFLDKEQSMEVMYQFHSSICGGHHYWKTTTHKILRAGYYWPTLFSDVFLFVKSCDKCQRFEGKQQLKSPPLKPVHSSGPFQQWGLLFIGEINPHSSGQHRWILVATDYFTKWIEAISTRKADHHVVINFLTENIFTRFGCPHKLVTNNAAAFRAKELVDMCDSMGIKLVHSTSSMVTTKKSIGNSPFKLVYGTEVVFPIQLTLPVAKFLQEEQNEEEDMAKRISDLVKVHQIRDHLVEKSTTHQKRIKEAFNRKEKINSFQVGDLVLKWDALKENKGSHGKFDSLWTRPFVITQIQGNNTFMLQSVEGETVFYGPING
eukprot:PITA_29852